MGRFLNADSYVSTGQGILGYNMFVYCGNNPVNRVDPSGEEWWHWALGAAIVVGCAVATVVTCGGFAAAGMAVGLVASGSAAFSAASTVAASAFIGSASAYGMAVLSAGFTSNSVEEFFAQGNWGDVIAPAGGAVFYGVAAYVATRPKTVTVYRSVSEAEAQDIMKTGQFNLSAHGMESKQFGFNMSETKLFGSKFGQDIIVSAQVPSNMIYNMYTEGVDTNIFRSGTLTVYDNQLEAFNQAISGTIKFYK